MARVYHSEENQKLFRELAEAGGYVFLNDEILKKSLKDFIDEHHFGNEEVWVFGYGSLIWNPQLNYIDKKVISLQGLQRSFCLQSSIGYGTRETPGLMLIVEENENAVCSGVAFKIAKENLWQELYHYWQREIRIDAYAPIMTSHVLNGERIKIITVVINKANSHYVPDLNLQEQAKLIAISKGAIEKNITYLNNLLVHLQEYGIEDDYLSKLQQAVKIVTNREEGYKNAGSHYYGIQVRLANHAACSRYPSRIGHSR